MERKRKLLFAETGRKGEVEAGMDGDRGAQRLINMARVSALGSGE